MSSQRATMSPEAHILEAKYSTLGAKYDSGKLRYSLIPPEATEALAKVLTFGATKYSANSWQHVPNASIRYLDALYRHLEAYRSGDLIDSESGLPHIYHVLTNAAFLTYFTAKDTNGNNSTITTNDNAY